MSLDKFYMKARSGDRTCFPLIEFVKILWGLNKKVFVFVFFFQNSEYKRQLDKVNLECLLIYFKIHIFGVKFNVKPSISSLIILNSVWN